MKSDLSLPSLVVLALALLAAPGSAAQRPAPAPAAPAEPVLPQKSVFINDPTVGKDPFFPKSSRRPLAATASAAPKIDRLAVNWDKIIYKGYSGTKEKRLAIINNQTVGVGEEIDLKLDGNTHRVRLVEIREHTAVVRIKGIVQELPLRGL